jgi:hypothetical protein
LRIGYIELCPFELGVLRGLKVDAMRQTDIVSTCGDKSLVDPMMAKVALLGDAFILIKCDGIVRACIDTCLTTRA